MVRKCRSIPLPALSYLLTGKMPLWRMEMSGLKKEHANILSELIDRTLNYFDDPKYKLYRQIKEPLSEKQTTIRNYSYLIESIRSKISQINTGSATPLMEIKNLKEIRSRFFDKKDNVLFKRSKEEVEEQVKLIDNKIFELEQEIKDRKELEDVLLQCISELQIEIKLMTLSK
jgi:vacuolar-type H+-ATPase subunit I/STV1